MLNRKINQGQGQRRIEGLLRGVAWEVPLRSLRRGAGHRKIDPNSSIQERLELEAF